MMMMAVFPSAKQPPLLLPLRLLIVVVVVVVFFFFFFVHAVALNPSSQKAALLEFDGAVGGKSYQWNPSTVVCSWKGIRCEKGIVTSLRLPGKSLAGAIPMGVFGNLTDLRVVSLRYNGLHSPLPSDLSACTKLRGLHLVSNFFSGNISVVLSMKSLKKLNLANNKFSGEIPGGINELSRLDMLYLENNSFSGKIPDLGKLSLRFFNVSYNNLSGPIPQSLRKWKKDSFLGMPYLCGAPLKDCPKKEQQPNIERPGKKLSGGAIAGIVVGAVSVFLLILVILFLCYRLRKSKKESVDVVPKDGNRNGEAGYGGEVTPVRRVFAVAPLGSTGSKGSAKSKTLVFFGRKDRAFELEDLLRASAEVLGKGTFGTAYKAMLEMGSTVAVKRLKDVDLPEAEFNEKIEAVGKMDHPNVVPLRAYYFSQDEKLLVYDFMPMGSLSALLHGSRQTDRTPLDWETRLSIAVGAARGILFIHSTGPEVSHGNIKSSNILLAKSDHALVSDHGLVQFARPSSTSNRFSGYRAPEVTDPRKVSQKADVYSFGILVLELLTGKVPAQAVLNDDGVDLPRWVQSIVREEWTTEVFDLELLRYRVEDEMVQLLQLALDCSAQYPDNRPTMSNVVASIEVIQRASLDPDEAEQQKPDSMKSPTAFMD